MERWKADHYKVPVYSWCKDIELGAKEQIEHMAQLPFAFHHVAIMPDTHQGYGMPIGGVLATKDVIIPNAVGVDIGCGMRVMETNLTIEQIKPHLRTIIREIRKVIPVGFEHNKEPHYNSMPTMGAFVPGEYTVIEKEYESAAKQIGTLGGGNHFIEIQKDEDNKIWIMIHSGSRNLGFQVANHYNGIAKDLNKLWHSNVPEKWELAFLPIETMEANDYLREMLYCVDFAQNNRWRMLSQITSVLINVFPNFNAEWTHDISHNYVALEHHFDKEIYIHRKGATRARLNEWGIIPGSQGTCSYIVKGLGNVDSFCSCSHGAGRKMGRKQAKKILNLEYEQETMEKQGILHSIRGKDDLDEAPGAYKDIDVVMEQQKKLVAIQTKLSPIGVIKA